jgi:hypothetical protein
VALTLNWEVEDVKSGGTRKAFRETCHGSCRLTRRLRGGVLVMTRVKGPCLGGGRVGCSKFRGVTSVGEACE